MITTPVSEYAAAVRAALADVPEPDRSELLEDLEDHLAEVAGESDEPLQARLGAPEDYAAELHAAYLQRPGQQRPAPGKKPSLLRRLDDRIAAFHTRVEKRFPWYETVRNDFRPAWWLLRGYLIALVGWTVLDGWFHPVPTGAFDLLLLIAAVTASVALGYRMRDGLRSRPLLILSLGGGLVALLAAFFVLTESSPRYESVPYTGLSDQQPYPGLANIYPYTKDGEPLQDVLLYDQDGRPIQLDHELYGYQAVPGPTPRIPNSFPLPICRPADGSGDEAPLVPVCGALNSEASPSFSPLPAPPPSSAPTHPKPTAPAPTPTATPDTTPPSPESSPTP